MEDKLLIVFGTRPELIKLAPIISGFEKRNLRDRIFILHTGQHNELISKDLTDFAIIPDGRLEWHRTSNSLSSLTASLLLQLEKFLLSCDHHFKAVIAQGDTCSTYCASLLALYHQLPFIHIEAGLRTNDVLNPFPEEYYRKAIALTAAMHFAPTLTDKQNLLIEGIPEDRIYVTGNTGIDHLLSLKRQDVKKDLIIITMHRRENQGSYIVEILTKITRLAQKYPGLQFVWITHPGVIMDTYASDKPSNLSFMPPVSFTEMLEMYNRTCLVFTDSGGMQEEAAYMGIPVIVLRRKTERTEGKEESIFEMMTEEFSKLQDVFQHMLSLDLKYPNTVYGDGYAAHRILEILSTHFTSCFKPTSALELASE